MRRKENRIGLVTEDGSPANLNGKPDMRRKENRPHLQTEQGTQANVNGKPDMRFNVNKNIFREKF